MSRPRAADDYAAIRARMEELQRERAQALSGLDESEPVTVLQPGPTFQLLPRATVPPPALRRLVERSRRVDFLE